MGPTYKIAALLGISSGEATAYCEKVRSMSGLGLTLQYKTIAQHLAQHLEESPSPQRMAEIVLTNKIIKPFMIKKPKRDKRPHAKISIKGDTSKAKKRSKRYRIPERAKSSSLPKDLVRTSVYDQERVSEEKLERCPHGVPKGRICAICNPKKFREMTGID